MIDGERRAKREGNRRMEARGESGLWHFNRVDILFFILIVCTHRHTQLQPMALSQSLSSAFVIR